MASIRYLYNRRARFSFLSILYLKAWAKRFLCFLELWRRNRRKRVLILKGAKISDTAEIGELIIEGPAAHLSIGELSFIGKATFALHHNLTIGSYVCINDGVRIMTASHDINDQYWRHIKKPIIISDYAWIATGAILLPGVVIGKGAVVGAGAVVSKNVEPFEIVVGNPAKSINKRRIEELNYNPCEFLAANQAWLKG